MTDNKTKVDAAQWLAVANKWSPKSIFTTEWMSGDTGPPAPGLYERHFEDGNHLHFWDGNLWWPDGAVGYKKMQPHSCQVGSFPCWRAFV